MPLLREAERRLSGAFADGIEVLDLRGTGLTSVDLTIGTSFGNVVISLSQGTITLTIPIEQVTAADFIFG